MSKVQDSQLRNKQELTAIQQCSAQRGQSVIGDDSARLLSLGIGRITGQHEPEELLDLRVDVIRATAAA